MSHPKFVNELPNPLDPSFIFQPTTPGGTHYKIGIYQFTQNLLGQGFPDTTVWGYGNESQPPTYPGRTFMVNSGQRITVEWTNNLVDANGAPLPHLLPVDTSLHWAFGHSDLTIEKNGVPVVTHLHGGHTESLSDGLPDAWFTPGYAETGRLFNPIYTYDNDQQAATIWYHDHALGITRLNVYAGLAGFYIIRDPVEKNLPLPKGPYDIPLVIQDRMFTEDGELFYPSDPEEGMGHGMASLEMHEPGEVPNPSVLPEFFGDFILVNGKTWPYLEVEPRKYRFRVLNGSDSRFYRMTLSSGQAFWQIATDTALLPRPVQLNELTLAPGERAEIVVDFAGQQGKTIILKNDAPSPFPYGDEVNENTTGQIMAFKVVTPLRGRDTSVVPRALRPGPPVQSLGRVARTRQVALFEAEDEYGRLQPLLGTVSAGALLWSDPITETPRLNDVEVWEIYNNTPDTHPVHLHLVSFRILSRQGFEADVNEETGVMSNIQLLGNSVPPAPNEDGWKDTVQVHPGEVVRIIAKFDRLGEYVWHCHILSHEDHEMMRPYVVIP